MSNINIAGLDKARVFAELFNDARPQGMGFIHFVPGDITAEQAAPVIASGQTYFDYVQGRVMKVDLSGDEFDPWLYDRDNGPGAAARAVARITG